MSNYANTKATIAANVYENHLNQVTANMAKAAINSVVDSLIAGGFLYKGVATTSTNPGTPDPNIFYIATAPGTYTNLGGLVVNDGEVAILKYNGSWTKEVTGAATAAEVAALGQKVGDLDSTLAEYEDKVRLSNTDTLYVVDGNGNVIAKIDADGVTSVDFIDANGKKFSQLSSILADISPKFDDTLYVADADGNVVAKIDKDGIQAVNFLDKNGNPFGGNLIGYQLFSLGDSLSAGGKWQAKVAALTGAEFDQAKNADGQLALSVGGTITGGDGFDNALWRAKHLIDGGYITDDGEKSVVILECVNDISVLGTSGSFDKTADTIVPTDPIEGYEYANWGAALLASIPSAQRKMNACFRLLITGQSGKNLAVSTMPSSEGDVTLRIYTSGAGTKDYSIHVLSTDTLQDILDKILEINYASVTDTLAANGTSVDFVGASISVSFIDGGTGMAVSITNTSSASSSTAMYFVGDSVSDWEDTSKWIRGTALTFSMAYKSVIEMLLKEYPKLHLFMGMFPALSDDPDTYALPNGNYDTYAFYNTTRMQQNRNLQSVLADIAAAYRIPFVDVFGLCGIGITNYSEFYYDNNVHPKDVGYDRFGEVVAASLCDRIV